MYVRPAAAHTTSAAKLSHGEAGQMRAGLKRDLQTGVMMFGHVSVFFYPHAFYISIHLFALFMLASLCFRETL